MYQALYRKYRPQTFDEVVGQKQVTDTLKHQVETGRLSHAYIFIGTRGTGKTTCARILAKAVNCEHPVNGNPCGECPSCKAIAAGQIMDIVELDAASNNGVDNVRALREEAVFSPAAVKKRVYIIDEVHMLSTSAFNALLKILEEPPEHLMFILATTELRKVPATILSRCQRHNFRRIMPAEITAYLRDIASRENINLTEDAAALIARLAEGGMRDALSLLDQCSAHTGIGIDEVYSVMGLAGARRTVRLLTDIVKHDSEQALQEFNEMWVEGKDPVSVLEELSGLVRDVLLLHAAPQAASRLFSGMCDESSLRAFAKHLTPEELLWMGRTLQRCQMETKGAKSTRTSVELCLISLCQNTMEESVGALNARVSRLEELLKHGIPAAAVSVPDFEFRLTEAEPVQPAAQPEREESQIPEEEDEAYQYDDADCPPPAPWDEEQAYRPQPEYKPEERFSAEAEPAPIQQPPRPAETRPAAPAAPAKAEIPPAVDSVQMLDAVKKKMPQIKAILDDEYKAKTEMTGNTLILHVQDGFCLTLMQNNKDRLAKAASEAAGTPIAVRIEKMKQEEHQQYNLDDLAKFPEVTLKN